MGWPRGRDPREAWSSKGYLLIEKFSIADFKKRAGSGPIGQLINDEASRLAHVLCQQDTGAVFDVIQYAVREILRNSAEHSESESVCIMAQYWPTKDVAEIVIIDDGVGVPHSLYGNDYAECANSREALKFALLPGISGVSIEDRIGQDDFWGNSGFGLFVTSRICAQNCQFRIFIDRQGLTLFGSSQIEHDWVLPGTCVQMRLDVRRTREVQTSIGRIIAEGESQRKTLMRNFPIQASADSKMLQSQYRKK